MKKILVLNMGMKSIRSIIFSVEGERLAAASCPLTTQLDGERVMQEPEEWWDKAQLVIQESLKNLKDKAIDYITVTASSACLVYVDNSGNVLDRCIMVSDKRAESESKFIKNMPDFKQVELETGVGMDSYLMLPKILWVKKNQPDLYEKTEKFLSPNDYLIYKMTGGYCTDPFNASKFHYDVKTGSYPIQLLEALAVDVNKLPKVMEVGSCVGKLTEEAVKLLGLSRNTKAIISAYDAICSFFGSGVSEEGEASDASGTVTAFRALSYKDSLKASSKIFISSLNRWNMNIVGGSNNLGGGLIEWAKQCFYRNELYPYEIMEKEAGEVVPGAGGLVFLPYLLGERAPLWDYDARGGFFGLERSHTRKDMTRAIFESTGYIVLDMIKAIEETGVKVSKIRFSGGLAQNDLIAQIKADITGLQVSVLEDFETTAIGAAMLALLGQGEYDSLRDVARCFVKVRMIILPNEKRHRQYMEIYKLYKDTYKCLKDLFPERMKMIRSIYGKQEIIIENL